MATRPGGPVVFAEETTKFVRLAEIARLERDLHGPGGTQATMAELLGPRLETICARSAIHAAAVGTWVNSGIP
ncbi:hypothetical protein [Nocardia sp. NPDC005366]|uniref:hypothetical protein n=1 Tax=Nocardia sp. NPDC005366 TaxID=3156878 RepID=UPI0033A563E3